MATANPFDATYQRKARGITPDGLPCAAVLRTCEGRETEYFLVQRMTINGPTWFSTGPQKISNGKVRFFAETRGVRLTDSRMDRTLKQYAEAA